MSSYTYREISARVNVQGGGSLNNLAVRRSTVFSNLFSIPAKGFDITSTVEVNSLVESTLNTIKNDAFLVQGIVTPLRNSIELSELNKNNESKRTELMNVLNPLLRSYLTESRSEGNFIDKVYGIMTEIFVSVAAGIIGESSTFLDDLKTNLRPYILESDNVLQSFLSQLQLRLPYTTNFMQRLESYYVTTLTTNNATFDSFLASKIKTNTVAVVIDKLINKTLYHMLKVTVPSKTTCVIDVIRMECTTLASAFATNIRFLVVDLSSFQTLKTIFNTSYPSTSVQPQTISTQGNYTNSEEFPKTIYLSAYCELNDNLFLRCEGNLKVIFTEINTQNYITVPPRYFLSPMRINAALASEPPLSLNIYNSQKALIKTILSPDSSRNGMVQYSGGNVLWSINLKFLVNWYVAQGDDYACYLACNVNGPVPLTTTLTNSYNGGLPIMIVKLLPNGSFGWRANLFSLGLVRNIVKGIVTDASNNVYVYGYYPTSDVFYAADATNNAIPIDLTFDSNLNVDTLNTFNSFVVKYDDTGNIKGYAIVKGTKNQYINDVFVDPTTNGVYLACTSDSEIATVIIDFNRTEILLPTKAKAFIVCLNNVDQSNVTQFSAVVSTQSENDSADADQVHADSIGNTFVLYSTTSQSASLFATNDTENVVYEASGPLSLVVKYDTTGSVSWYLMFRSLHFINDRKQMCIDSTGKLCIMLRSSGSLIIDYTTGLNDTLSLPSDAVDVTFLMQFFDPDITASVVVQKNLTDYLMISNCTVHRMVKTQICMFVDYQFVNVSNIYRRGLNNVSVKEISVGIEGRTGNCVLRIDPDFSVSLVGYCMSAPL